MDPTDSGPRPLARIERSRPPHLPGADFKPTLAPLPAEIPPTSPLAHLHAALQTSPHLEPGTLLVREPVHTEAGPPLPPALPKGRRRRGGTYFGEGLGDALESGGIWSWILVAQVKDGTENRGAIESVIRLVRKTLLTSTPPLPLPPNSKRRVNDGWAMLDAGDFAVHIVSREARQQYFPERRDFVRL
ncbi:hypothetical protein EIP91_002756 [Steccherinum ochraceum]|uniref:Uncharacterized protein n=1 Tax=Steccherinum ochraceum TaxID=92696 RepID=A0A4R0RNC5_9APHY|nr:hypothetical protein EIP91_002756 [Steccherinum ochraceum]